MSDYAAELEKSLQRCEKELEEAQAALEYFEYWYHFSKLDLESEEADEWRDKMDDPWHRMSDQYRTFFQNLAIQDQIYE